MAQAAQTETQTSPAANPMSLSEGWSEGRKWARINPNATKAERDARVEEFRAAWGDSASHGFWKGATEDLR